MRDKEKEALRGIWDRAEYMNKVNWPGKKLKEGYNIKMCFYILRRLRRIGLCGAVRLLTELKKRDNKIIQVDIKWDNIFTA